jgi:hypothetical protein
VAVLKPLIKEYDMSTPSASFDANLPYRLSESEASSLQQVLALLAMLASLSGQASVNRPDDTPDFTTKELHEALWGLYQSVNSVVQSYLKRSAA